MSLDRFLNIDDLLAGSTKYPNKWTDTLQAAASLGALAIDPAINLKNNLENLNLEAHLYTRDGAYVDSAYGIQADVDVENKFGINTKSFIDKINVKSGNYIVVFNIHDGVPETGNYSNPGLYIEELSTDRTELYIRGNPESATYSDFLTSARDTLILNDALRSILLNGNLVLNSGKGNISTIVSIAGWNDADGVVIKLLKPLSEEVNELEKVWFEIELADPVLQDIVISSTPEDTKIYLRSPNFDAYSEYNTITETDFQNYTQLLGSSTSTSEQIIQKLVSGSIPNSPIGVDYSGFQNFVFYSSAAERLANFKYKIQQLEHYDSQIELLMTSSSIIPTVGTDKLKAEKRKSAIIGSFDGFEKWLYNEPTSSLFTHQAVYDREHNSGNPTRLEGGLLGSDVYQIQPYPKFISASDGGGRYKIHHTTSSIATNWYNGTLASASLYDELNDKRLVELIPEHIRLDSNNDQYELFVNMIGHHFDILYSYADALAKTYHPIEHPKLGHTKDTLFNVAKSLGWKLFNGKQASALWQYKLGYNSETGSFASTGSIFTKTDEDITTEVWRRIVNNLPYLLKTKGTARGVKALMNTYGIPQTLLSIREYGGPKVNEDTPLLIEDRFSYALRMNSGSNLRIHRDHYSSTIDSWGIAPGDNPTLNKSPDAITGSYHIRPADTIEFRFKPAVKTSMYLLSARPKLEASHNNKHWSLGIQHTGSYSGSTEYGRLVFQMRNLGGGGISDTTIGNTLTSFSDYVPLYDGDFWNVRLFTEFPFITASHDTNTIPTVFFQTQKASDYITDKIIHQTSGSIFFGSGSTPTNGDNLVKYWAAKTQTKDLILGGATGSGLFASAGIIASHFSGSIQEYREWLEVLDQKTFNLHTTNPSSYVSSISPTSSFDTLVRHYPLGTDLKAIDHSSGAGLIISSSHPNQAIKDFSSAFGDFANTYASASGFVTPVNAQRGNYLPVEETYYVQGASLGATLPKSQKIRFDDNELITRLSPVATAETSRFDNASLDSNKLGLFYSMADQINKEIFNQIGDVALDDFVGDPDDQYEFVYPDLNSFAKEYWKKYTDRNDINAFMRIFAQFDFALFESIRQMLPDRADEAMGLIVEPHILERAKVVPFKKPEQSPHHYETLLTGLAPSSSGAYLTYEGSASGAPIMTGETPFSPPAGDNGYSDVGNYFGEIIPKPKGQGTDYFTKQIFPVDESPSVSGSVLNAYLVVGESNEFGQEDPGPNNYRFDTDEIPNMFDRNNSTSLFRDQSVALPAGSVSEKIRVQYDTYLQTDTVQDLQVFLRYDDAMDAKTTGSLHAKFITTQDNAAVSALNSPISESVFISRDLTETKNELFFMESIPDKTTTLLFKDVHIPRRTDITFELQFSARNVEGSGSMPRVHQLELVQTINKAGFAFGDDIIDKFRPSTIFKKKVLHYHSSSANLSKLRNNELRAISESLHHSLFANADDAYSNPSTFTYSSSLTDIHYRDDENKTNEIKYAGTSISAPGINVVSGYAELGYEPIVEIFITNPNQVIYNDTPQVTEIGQENPGNISISAGPAILVNRPIRPSRGSSRPRVSYR